MVANLKSVAPLIAREVENEKETALVEDVARFIDFRFTWYKILISNWPYQIALPEGCCPGIIRSPDNSACDLQEAPPVQCGRDLAERSWCPTRLYLGFLCWCEWQLVWLILFLKFRSKTKEARAFHLLTWLQCFFRNYRPITLPSLEDYAHKLSMWAFVGLHLWTKTSLNMFIKQLLLYDGATMIHVMTVVVAISIAAAGWWWWWWWWWWCRPDCGGCFDFFHASASWRHTMWLRGSAIGTTTGEVPADHRCQPQQTGNSFVE